MVTSTRSSSRVSNRLKETTSTMKQCSDHDKEVIVTTQSPAKQRNNSPISHVSTQEILLTNNQNGNMNIITNSVDTTKNNNSNYRIDFSSDDKSSHIESRCSVSINSSHTRSSSSPSLVATSSTSPGSSEATVISLPTQALLMLKQEPSPHPSMQHSDMILRSDSRCSQHSSASTDNNSATGRPPSRTTTSRRGGRASRSRSPASSFSSRGSNKCHSALPMGQQKNKNDTTFLSSKLLMERSMSDEEREEKKVSEGVSSVDGIRQTEGVYVERRKEASRSTPSTAAAAAAEAAQRFCDNPAPNMRWFHPRDREIESHAHGRHDGPHIDRQHWKHPHDDFDEARIHGGNSRHSPSKRERDHHVEDYRRDDRRHDKQSVFRRSQASTSPPARRYMYRDEYEGQGRPVISTRSMNKILKPAVGSGGTTRVMGSATPMHFPMPSTRLSPKVSPRVSPKVSPRVSPKVSPNDQAYNSSTPKTDPLSEIFRTASVSDELHSPQNLLLGLSKSFDLKSPGPSPKAAPLSPQEPPQIQLAHQQLSFVFDPQKTPKPPNTPTPRTPQKNGGFEATPSFSLFNEHFDSFDDADNYLRTPIPNNSSALLLDSALRSPTFCVGDETPNTRKAMNSPYIGGFAFSPKFRKSPMSDRCTIDVNSTKSAPLMPRQVEERQIKTSNQKTSEKLFNEKVQLPPLKKRMPVPSFNSKPIPIPTSVKVEEKIDNKKSYPVKDEKKVLASVTYVKPYVKPYLKPVKSQVIEKVPFKESTYYRPTMPPQNHQDQRRRPPSHPYGIHNRHNPKHSLSGMKAPHFYHKLSCHKEAFGHLTFLLPGLKAIMKSQTSKDSAVRSQPLSSGSNEIKNVRECSASPEAPVSLLSSSPSGCDAVVMKARTYRSSYSEVAGRRVTSAVFAFGGSCSSSACKTEKVKDYSKSSIFRTKPTDGKDIQSEGKKSYYEESLKGRYYENENRISWEVEEDPPVATSSVISVVPKHSRDESFKRKSPINSSDAMTPLKKQKIAEFNSDECNSSTPVGGDQPKMRYRCKLCGQPKQNHTCPYQQSLQRSIGVMIYPAINSFTAFEPGCLAPSLSEMNNFVDSNENGYPTENTPSRPSGRHMMTQSYAGPSPTLLPFGAPNSVTPESLRSNQNIRNPGKPAVSSTVESSTPPRKMYKPIHYSHYPVGMTMSGQPTPSSMRRKRVLTPDSNSADSKDSCSDFLFMERCDLKPEQFRTVTVSSTSSTAFKYPSLPLPYGQRKVLSDNLFSLSKEVPQLTDECASVLRLAREQDRWDVAVAQLLTQVIVVIHCPEDDVRLDGLSRYLLSLGYSC